MGMDKAEEEVRDILLIAQNSKTKKDTLTNLTRARDKCKDMDNGIMRFTLLAETCAAFAEETLLSSERKGLWNKCRDYCIRGINEYNEPSLVDLYVRKTVDYVQDSSSSLNTHDANSLLYSVINTVDVCCDSAPDAKDRALLLARKSSLLRNMSRFQAKYSLQESMAGKSLSCINKALEMDSESWQLFLERALSLWHNSQYAINDYEYNRYLEDVESAFWESIDLLPNAYNLFSLASFFRATYQAIPFLEIFNLYSKKERYQRKFLRNTFMLGEAAIQLWYNVGTSGTIKPYLNEAETQLQKAIDSGCEEARHIVDLAFIKSAKGDLTVGLQLIDTLHPMGQNVDWTTVADKVAKTNSQDDLILQGFALGIADSAVWNKLGTFAVTFLRNPELADKMYRQSITLNKKNAVAMTNLARLLANNGSLDEAADVIKDVGSIAGKRFRWWRNVRDDIQNGLASRTSKVVHVVDLNVFKKNLLRNLPRSFAELRYVTDIRERNKMLLQIVDNLVYQSLSNSSKYLKSKSSYSDTLVDSGSYFFEKDRSLIEALWLQDKVEADSIENFASRLASKKNGLFISINGFSDEAIEKARELGRMTPILLMEGDEFEPILHGSPTLGYVMSLKQIEQGKTLNPFYKIKAERQLEIS